MDKAGQAKMGELTPDGLLVHVALCNMRGDKLKEKFLMAEDLTVVKMREIAATFEMAEANKAETNKVCHTSSKPQISGQGDQCNRSCFACGEKGHIRPDCRKELFCTFCDKPGHNAVVCHNKKRVDRAGTPESKKAQAKRVATTISFGGVYN